MFTLIKEQSAKGLPARLGMATGQTMIGLYEELARSLNQDQTDLSRLSTYNLDEYLAPDGGAVANDFPLGYRRYMREKFYSLLSPKLGFSKDRMFFPDPKNPVRYDDDIQKTGGLDLQLLGVGFNGHIAFNEPISRHEISVENFLTLPSRVVDLKELTIKTNADLTANGNLDRVPKQAVTMGMKTILHAKKILVLACFKEQSSPLKALKQGVITPEIPITALIRHPDCVIIHTQDISL
ncbi:MAG: glucosamine-6-phosphate deaminase [Verrucomicrobiae bacterium]|nr:glucosamine-6-phosphate deaminase [Verrucomicrobiae bacterium]